MIISFFFLFTVISRKMGEALDIWRAAIGSYNMVFRMTPSTFVPFIILLLYQLLSFIF